MTAGAQVIHQGLVGGGRIGGDGLPDEGVDPGSEQPEVFGRYLTGEARRARHLAGHPQRLDFLGNLFNEFDAEVERSLRKPKRRIVVTDNARIFRLARRLCKGATLCPRQIAQNDRIARRLRRASSGTSKRPGLNPALVRVSSQTPDDAQQKAMPDFIGFERRFVEGSKIRGLHTQTTFLHKKRTPGIKRARERSYPISLTGKDNMAIKDDNERQRKVLLDRREALTCIT